jgi:fatty-acyl-CoA synthase
MSIYDIDLDKTPANYQPLTPLSFLARSAAVYPDHIAIIHGKSRTTYAAFYARARKLASTLVKAGIKKGDTVSVILANTPAMLECHYGVPMTGAVLNTLNTRLDATTIGFSLDHAETKLLIVDKEFSGLAKNAIQLMKGPKPIVVDYVDPEFAVEGERLSSIEYEQFISGGDANFEWLWPGDEWEAISLPSLYLRHHGQSQGRGLSSSRGLSAGAG